MSKERSATIVLDFPVQLADRVLTELTMRRPTVGEEIRYAPSSGNLRTQAEDEAKYFARLCGIKTEELHALDMEDYDKLQKQFLIFRGKLHADEGFEADGGPVEPSGADAAG